jgi:hypothetical protein
MMPLINVSNPVVVFAANSIRHCVHVLVCPYLHDQFLQVFSQGLPVVGIILSMAWGRLSDTWNSSASKWASAVPACQSWPSQIPVQPVTSWWTKTSHNMKEITARGGFASTCQQNIEMPRPALCSKREKHRS